MNTFQIEIFISVAGEPRRILSGELSGNLIPGFLVAISRLRDLMPLSVKVDGRLVTGFRVNSAGGFLMQCKKVEALGD